MEMTDKSTSSLEVASSSNSLENMLPGYKCVEDFTKDGYKCLMEGIKHANSLPTGRDWNFYTTFDSFKKVMNNESNKLVDSINAVLIKNEVGANMRNHTMENKTEILIDANDLILERVANNIDEMNGIKKSDNEPVVLQTVSAQLPVNINGSWNRTNNATFSVTSSILPLRGPSSRNKGTTIRLLTAENIVRPQKYFKDKIDNRNGNPWEPKIKEKPNSLKPLAIFLEETEHGHEFSHPYEYELDRFVPPITQLNKTKVNKPKLLIDTPLIEVNKPEQLQELVDGLRKCQVIAVDLEHHSYRSFMGITCLMQISTLEKDYLIDTLALRSDLWVLNEIFTKSDIVKIFHGAQSDIQWLQRDLSIYVVNMFDTYFAAKQLEYSGLSLAFLMQRFCNFIPNKQFQLADWRIRPLPDELKNYAREDTHYLIYIYQNMKNELLDIANGRDNLLRSVIHQSTELCKKRYFKPLWHENSHLEFYRRCNRMFDNRQLFALKEIYKWRDHISREEDESIGYVLPNNMLLEIAGRLPKEMQGILACCSPVPPLVRANLLEIHKIILKALEKPFEEPILKEDTRARGSTKKMSKINVDSPLHCPHDLTKSREFRDDLPTILGSVNKEKSEDKVTTKFVLEKTASMFSVFNTPENSDDEAENNANKKLQHFRDNFKFLGPFERYQLVKPFIEAKEKKMAEERAKEEQEKAKNQSNLETAAEGSKRPNADSRPEEDNRTDEERIESIREHFLNLSRKSLPPKPKEPKKMSLLEMGGSKKRKRDESILRGYRSSDSELPVNPLSTPVPNLQITFHTEAHIRKLTETEVSKLKSITTKSPKLSGKEKRRLLFKKRLEKRVEMPQEEQDKRVDGAHDSQDGSSFLIDRQGDPNKNTLAKRGFPKNKRNRGKRNRGGQNKGQNDSHNRDQSSNFRGNKHQKRRGGKQGNISQNQGNEEFNAYDYSMVDFRQFQGGAREANKPKQFKSKFRGRGKPNKGGNRGNNKSMTFGRGKGR